MPVEIIVGTPLADALNGAIQGKIAELGWASGGAEDSAMAEYFVLMLANGKTQDEIAAEISGDLLGLGPDDPTAPDFARWVFDQINTLGAQLNEAGDDGGAPGAAGGAGTATVVTTTEGANDDYAAMPTSQDDSIDGEASAGFADTEMGAGGNDGLGEFNAPTGPKAMRNGTGGSFRGGREKRMLGQINRAMDRQLNDPLHRVRSQSGGERIARATPTGPRGVGRQPRMVGTGRAASIAHGMGMPMMGPTPGPPPPPMNGVMNPMNMGGPLSPMPNGFMMPGQPDIFAMMEHQNRLLQSMQQQLLMQQQANGQQTGGQVNGHGQGKSLFERASRPGNWRRGGAQAQNNQHHHNNGSGNGMTGGQISHTGETPQPSEGPKAEGEEQHGEDVDMDMAGSKREQSTNPEETICKFNLRCTNKECKFAHQSPAAPPGVTIDVKDTCSYGAACKNHKCVGRHPSPANKMAHQGEQDCKFFPNCTNPRCPFRHPAMPPCRNGGECKMPNCMFTHVKTPCKYHPCTNRFCPFTHEEGQRGTFQDKVWTAGEGGEQQHVSERKFIGESANEGDLVVPDDEALAAEVIV